MFKSLIFFTAFINIALCSDVLEFKDSNFERSVAEHSIILVEFFAPWCGHCKRLAPEYEIAATALKNSDPPVGLAKVDCTAETKTCEKHGVSGYPTLKVFKGGAFAYDYNGERTGDGIVKYMSSKSGPVSRVINTDDDSSKISNSKVSIVLGYFKVEGSDLHLTFQKVAEKLNEDIKFSHTFSEVIAKKLGMEEGIHIVHPKIMASKFEESINKYSGAKSEYEIKSWIEKNIMGIAGLRTTTNSKFFNERPLVIAYYNADYEKNPKGSNYWRNRILKVGTKFLDSKTNIHFAISNSLQMGQELAEYGIENPDASKVYIAIRNEKNNKFKMSEEFSMENLEIFINNFLSGKLTAYLKSESVPEKNDDAVKVVVAKTFEEIVNDPTKDVLIEFYAPWCGHCKSLAPKYEELAQKLNNEPEIVIAKMDATANDVPTGYDVTGFPTLFFVPKNKKSSPIPYNGGRETEDFLKYIAAESTSPLKGYDRKGRLSKSDL